MRKLNITKEYFFLLKKSQELDTQMELQRKIWRVLEEERFNLDNKIKNIEKKLDKKCHKNI
jgi:uncharacterized protein YlxW (UPF0749 family)